MVGARIQNGEDLRKDVREMLYIIDGGSRQDLACVYGIQGGIWLVREHIHQIDTKEK